MHGREERLRRLLSREALEDDRFGAQDLEHLRNDGVAAGVGDLPASAIAATYDSPSSEPTSNRTGGESVLFLLLGTGAGGSGDP